MSERCLRQERNRRRPWRGPQLIAVMVLLAGCQARQASRSLRGEPAIQATVVTIQTTIQPQNRTFTHWLVIGADMARSGDEVDQWRLFDLKNRRVFFVDDIARTYRTESLSALLRAAGQKAVRDLPPGVPRVTVTRTAARRNIQGADASQIVMRAGSYAREVWIATHPLIPRQLFPMMLASAPPSSPLSAMTRSVNDVLLGSNGFPFADHSEMAYADRKLIVDHTVVKIEKRDVPQSWLTISAKYRDITPKPPPPATPTTPRARR